MEIVTRFTNARSTAEVRKQSTAGARLLVGSTLALVRSRLLLSIPPLPFCTARLTAQWKRPDYPRELRHLGDHIRAKRLDLRLQVKQLAIQLHKDEGSVASWEGGLRKPSLAKLPLVLAFLGHDPRPTSNSVGGRLKRWRETHGIAQSSLAQRLKVDPGTLQRWERGGGEPRGRHLECALQLLAEAALVDSATG